MKKSEADSFYSLRLAARAMFFNGRSEVLLLRKSDDGKLLLPGGGLEYAEIEDRNLLDVLAETVLWRELGEEIGLSPRRKRALQRRHLYPVAAVEWEQYLRNSVQVRLDFVSAIYLGGSQRMPVRPEKGVFNEAVWLDLMGYYQSEDIHPNTHTALMRLKKILRGEANWGYDFTYRSYGN